MKEELSALLLLQEIDKEILKQEESQKRLPARVYKIQNMLESAEKRLKEKKQNLKDLQLKIKRKEIDVKAVNEKIKKHQDELYGGKIGEIKELKHLQRVIESLKKDQDKVEEDLLILMDQEDGHKVDLDKIEKELLETKNQLEERKKEVDHQEKSIEESIKEKNKKREEIAGQINDHELMQRYHMLWREKEGQAIVEIDGPICSGCNLSLPSDIIYHLQKRDGLLITCPNCNRILVWKREM